MIRIFIKVSYTLMNRTCLNKRPSWKFYKICVVLLKLNLKEKLTGILHSFVILSGFF